jgi:hypothetical protein
MKEHVIICNQIAIMEALVVIMAHTDDNSLGKMTKTWQFDYIKERIEASREDK